jgi:hypothetical protein
MRPSALRWPETAHLAHADRVAPREGKGKSLHGGLNITHPVC